MGRFHISDNLDTSERAVTFSYRQADFLNDYGMNRIVDRLLDDIAKALVKDLRDEIVAGLNIKAIQKELTVKVSAAIAQQLVEAKHDVTKFGLCPYCNEQIKDYKHPMGSFAPEAYATLREHGIDPSTGHKQSCKHKEIRL